MCRRACFFFSVLVCLSTKSSDKLLTRLIVHKVHIWTGLHMVYTTCLHLVKFLLDLPLRGFGAWHRSDAWLKEFSECNRKCRIGSDVSERDQAPKWADWSGPCNKKKSDPEARSHHKDHRTQDHVKFNHTAHELKRSHNMYLAVKHFLAQPD